MVQSLVFETPKIRVRRKSRIPSTGSAITWTGVQTFGAGIVFTGGGSMVGVSNGNINIKDKNGNIIFTHEVTPTLTGDAMNLIDTSPIDGSAVSQYGLRINTNGINPNVVAAIGIANNGLSDGLYINQANSTGGTGIGIDIRGASGYGINEQVHFAGGKGLFIGHDSGQTWGAGVRLQGEANNLDLYPLVDTSPANSLLRILNAALSVLQFGVNKSGVIGTYNAVPTAGLGLPAVYGAPDWRFGVTAVDGAPITIYTTVNGTSVFKFNARVLATTLGAGGAVSYVLKWTEGGAVITKTLTVNAVNTDADLSIPIMPDTATAITAQVTALSGAGTAVNVAAWTEEVK